mmetsp:Transcript_37178/g.57080  ORF Transcript_37178/g.57080 Transcript_37178/m.57080 type:complete len:85 (-) Transcript_37178:3738-3992(-)
MSVKLEAGEFTQFQRMLRGNDFLENTSSGGSSSQEDSEEQKSSSSNNMMAYKFSKGRADDLNKSATSSNHFFRDPSPQSRPITR